jgi:hypothetical protein
VIPSKAGYTAIHAAAEAGFLAQIPRDRLTIDLLITRNDFGDTPLHAAAVEGHLDQIPREFFNRSTLFLRNYNGGTPIGAAIRHGHADQLPDEYRPKPIGPLRRFLIRLGLARPPFA